MFVYIYIYIKDMCIHSYLHQRQRLRYLRHWLVYCLLTTLQNKKHIESENFSCPQFDESETLKLCVKGFYSEKDRKVFFFYPAVDKNTTIMSQIAPCAMLDLSRKLQEYPFMRFF